MMNKYLISIVGPTGIGKTALSLELAKQFNTEILSADSRQFFKEIPIGTAAPTAAELAVAPHHFIHNKSITDTYSVGSFEKEAIAKLEELFRSKSTVVMAGGSGLYVDAVIKGFDTFPDVAPELREQLNLELETKGLKALQDELKQLDPKSYETMALKNPHRVIRALEICRGTGLPFSSFLNQNKPERHFKTISIGLEADRSLIYERINLRVDKMLEHGLIEEAKSVFEYRKCNALNTVAYKELFNYFNKEWTLEFAVSEIKKNTRRFAKRQLTWFKKDPSTQWFKYNTDVEVITDYIKKVQQKTS
ncbi:tRNA (adenosine(37)-N6)-dimethylallyltransferase MiaA [Flavobacteriaceae bacterium]|nr:tRNA (adenosine(37)-N6)-dimethylallyltransferase MiaA [Flavobacteriaceae bacterium]MDC1539213.1 tRNA (adenosine(37)-N6)-dimethylallyltransferase MiaA [Flavobacteriaceae bacterium]